MTALFEEQVVGPDERYRSALDNGRFELQHCGHCQRSIFYPRVLCPHCGDRELTWREADGRGVVYSTTVNRSRSGDANIVLVDLAEGVRMMARVDGVEPESVEIGMAVRAVIAKSEAGPLVVFEPDVNR